MEKFVLAISNAAQRFIDRTDREGLIRVQEANTPVEAMQLWMLRMMFAGFVFEDPLPMHVPADAGGWALVTSDSYSAWREMDATILSYRRWTADEEAQIRAWLAEWTGRAE